MYWVSGLLNNLFTGFYVYFIFTLYVCFIQFVYYLYILLKKLIYYTGDLVFDGHGGRGLMFEAGLYPTARAKYWREKGTQALETVLPDGIWEALDWFEEHKEGARSKSGSSRGHGVIKR